MRPTVEEQLRETRRIMIDVIAPALNTDHATEVLRSLLANLEMLQTSWMKVLPFLHWENNAVEQLLRDIGERTDIADSDLSDDPFDVAAASARNDALLSILEARIAKAEPGDPAVNRIRDHLHERVVRYPMRSILPTPRARAAT